MNIGQNIKKRREQLGMKQIELARLLGVSAQSVTQWESTDPKQRTTPRGRRLDAIARALETTTLALITGDDGGLQRGRSGTSYFAPILDWQQASAWQRDRTIPEDALTMACPVPCGLNTFAVQLDAAIQMSPRFAPGEIVFADPDLVPESGQYVIARLLSEESALLRQCVHDGDRVYLIAENPTWPEHILRLSDPAEQIIATVICRLEKLI